MPGSGEGHSNQPWVVRKAAVAMAGRKGDDSGAGSGPAKSGTASARTKPQQRPQQKTLGKNQAKPASTAAPARKKRVRRSGPHPNKQIPVTGKPLPQDVLFGRGKPFQNHPGNHRLHAICDSFINQYWQSTREQKLAITRHIIVCIKTQHGGRFLRRCTVTVPRNIIVGGDGNSDANPDPWWYEVEDAEAREKVSHTIRSRSRMPDSPPEDDVHESSGGSALSEVAAANIRRSDSNDDSSSSSSSTEERAGIGSPISESVSTSSSSSMNYRDGTDRVPQQEATEVQTPPSHNLMRSVHSQQRLPKQPPMQPARPQSQQIHSVRMPVSSVPTNGESTTSNNSISLVGNEHSQSNRINSNHVQASHGVVIPPELTRLIGAPLINEQATTTRPQAQPQSQAISFLSNFNQLVQQQQRSQPALVVQPRAWTLPPPSAPQASLSPAQLISMVQAFGETVMPSVASVPAMLTPQEMVMIAALRMQGLPNTQQQSNPAPTPLFLQLLAQLQSQGTLPQTATVSQAAPAPPPQPNIQQCSTQDIAMELLRRQQQPS